MARTLIGWRGPAGAGNGGLSDADREQLTQASEDSSAALERPEIVDVPPAQPATQC